MRIKSIALLLVCMAVLCSCNKYKRLDNIFTSSIPDFSVVTNRGETVNLLSLIGKPAFLFTFDTKSDECRQILPTIQSLYDSYGSGVKFVGISSADGKESVGAYWKAHGFSMPYSAQDDNEQASKFSDEVPCVIIIDGYMNIVATYYKGEMPNLQGFSEVMKIFKN